MQKYTMIDEIFEKFDGAFAENTMRAYRSDFEQYSKWCANKSIPPIPATADNLAMYVDDLSQTCKSATIRRRVNSLGTMFKLSKNPDPSKNPEVVLAMKRMHRRIGRYQKQATPLTRDIIDIMLEKCNHDATGHRDRVLLLLGYETMRRRSELCNFKFADITKRQNKGHAIRLVRSKNDQEGTSRLLQISDKLHTLLMEWKHKYQLDGFILRPVDRHGNIGSQLSSGSVVKILSKLNRNLGGEIENLHYSGHSFRVGAAIDLLDAGASMETIMLRGGWRSRDNALQYLRFWQRN